MVLWSIPAAGSIAKIAKSAAPESWLGITPEKHCATNSG